jgi:CPA1 family monovalent cation:H+ antiporter
VFARSVTVPYPVLLVIAGLMLSLVPELPEVQLDPAVVFYLILPPILYHAAIHTSWRDFRRNLRPIGTLAVGLVLATTLAVGCAAKLLIPEMSWATAFVLGAIVSPPDAIAATAVLQRIKVPSRIVTILEGESLINDATGLVVLKFAVAAVLTHSFSLGAATQQFFYMAVVGILIGLVIGEISARAHSRIGDTAIAIKISLIVPFVAYVGAEWAEASGVLSVVAAGLVRGWRAPEMFSAESRVQAYAVWDTIIFVINGLVFILIGLQLPDFADVAALRNNISLVRLLAEAAAISAVAILVRLAWTYLAMLLRRLLRHKKPGPTAWRESTVIGWTGMRGVVSLAAAQALPLYLENGEPFPDRTLILHLSFAVIFATLVVQGTTLPFLLRRLGLGADTMLEREERLAREKATHAAIARIDTLAAERNLPRDVVDGVRRDYERRQLFLAAQRRAEDTSGHSRLADIVRELRLEAVAAERRRIIKLRRDGLIGDEALSRIQRELDLEEMRLT